jgi:hypothetical protein
MKNINNSILLAKLSIAAVIIYHLLITALIFIRTDLDPSWHPLSEYAIGSNGWIMSLAFIISSFSYGTLLFNIKSHVKGFFGKLGLYILFICCVGTFCVGMFTTDPLTTAPDKISTTGLIHMFSGMAGLFLFPIAALLINLSIALKNKSWAQSKKALLFSSVIPLLGLVGFIIHLSIYVIPKGDYAYGPDVPLGYPPRLLFLTYMAWLLIINMQLIKIQKSNHNQN